MFLFVGGVVGFLLALTLGTTAVWPLQVFTPAVALSFVVGVGGVV